MSFSCCLEMMIRSAYALSYKYQFITRNVEMLRVYRSFLKKIRENPDRSRQLLCENNCMLILSISSFLATTVYRYQF